MNTNPSALAPTGTADDPQSDPAFGEHGSNQLLVASQVVLSLQLPLAVIPLVRFASDAGLMGRWRIKRIPLALAWLCAALIVLLNGALLWQLLTDS